MAMSIYNSIKNYLKQRLTIEQRITLINKKKHIKKIIKDMVPHDFVTNYEKLNTDKTFYVIRREPPGSGLFSNFHWVLGHIRLV
ncbi:hypothetical protein Holit_02137 [Hollandina sp. SP2]